MLRSQIAFSLVILVGGSLLAHGQSDGKELPSAPQTLPMYHPMTLKERMTWLVRSTVGGESLIAGGFSAAIGTAEQRPKEYDTHFDGFAQRYGMRMAGVATSNTMEAGIGMLLGEDPHYYRTVPGTPFKGRLKNVVRETFYARERDGGYAPAYARLIAVPGSNFLSNTWRADSEANVHDALIRTALGFAGHMTRNAWEEFRPDKH